MRKAGIADLSILLVVVVQGWSAWAGASGWGMGAVASRTACGRCNGVQCLTSLVQLSGNSPQHLGPEEDEEPPDGRRLTLAAFGGGPWRLGGLGLEVSEPCCLSNSRYFRCERLAAGVVYPLSVGMDRRGPLI